MRLKVLILTLAMPVLLHAAEQASGRATKRAYVHAAFGKRAVAGAVVHGAIGQVMNRPKEWGQGAGGFGKRVASGFAGHIVKTSIEYPVAAIRHEDLRYHRSTDTRFAPRLRHALVSTVITQKTTTGKKTVASGRISGAIGSGLISRAWQPAALRTVGGGLASGGISLGIDAGANVAQEFWPRRKSKASR